MRRGWIICRNLGGANLLLLGFRVGKYELVGKYAPPPCELQSDPLPARSKYESVHPNQYVSPASLHGAPTLLLPG